MSSVDSHKRNLDRWVWALVLLIIVVVGILRARLLALPLERDEGEYAYTGQLLLQGVPPFKLAYTMKLPGTTIAYALIMALFGQTPTGIHLGLLIVNAITIVLVFLLGKKLLGAYGGVSACAAYAVMSLSYSVLGLSAHATHFVVLFAVAGVLVFLRAIESGRLVHFFLSGVLFGIAFLMKQPGIFFSLFGAVLIVWFEIKLLKELVESRQLGFKNPRFNWERCFKRLMTYSLGVTLPFALTCLVLWQAGVFKQFWFWIFTYSSAYGSRISGHEGFQYLLEHFQDRSGADVLLWIVAAIGLLLMLFDRKPGDRKLILLTLLVVSLFAVCPGLYFREHYFVLALPAISLLVGYGFTFLLKLIGQAKFHPLTKALPAAALFLICLLIIFEERQRQILFKDTPAVASRDLFKKGNPFAESPEIARYIQEHTKKDDQIAILGSEPQIYFYAGRRSVTGYIYTYGLVELNAPAERMQKEMIHEIEAGKPEIVLVVELPLSWLSSKDSEDMIFNWVQKYSDEFYDLVGVVSYLPSGTSESHWGADAANCKMWQEDCIYVLKRKSSN